MYYQKRLRNFMAMLLCAVLAVWGIRSGQPKTAYAASNVLTISSLREMNEFATKVNNGNTYKGYIVKLTQNLSYEGVHYTPVGKFEGTFDGGGHTISDINLIVDDADEDGVGLFTEVVKGTVKNLTLKNCDFFYNGTEYIKVGSIVGVLSGTLDNCHVINGNVTDSSTTASAVGGVVGIMNDLYYESEMLTKCSPSIINCSSSATVSSASGTAGGIAGVIYGGKIQNSYNSGAVTGGEFSGGLVGQNDGTIQNCYNIGKAAYGLADKAGGIISNCYCSEESSSANLNAVYGVETYNKAYPASYMKTDSFLELLNKNASKRDNWRKWEFRSNVSSYPLLAKSLSSQTIKAKVAAKTYKRSKLKTAKKTFQIGGSAKTYLTYKVKTGKKYISVTAKGNVTVKKNTPKGTYTITVTAEGTAKYKKATKEIKIKVV
jgi:hypothetical protein